MTLIRSLRTGASRIKGSYFEFELNEGENVMRDIILTIDRFGDQALLLGRVNENRATRVLIDIKSILSQYPDAIASITVKQPSRVEYPAAVKQEGGILTWEITRADIGDKSGRGQAQITIQDADGTIIKTAIACTRIGESLGNATAPAPDPVETWIDKATGTLADVERAGNAAQAVADEVQRRLDNGDFVGPQGPQGAPGARGEKGEKGDPGKDAPQEAVLYTAQTLDDAQKAQARENIGAADAARQNVLVGGETGNPIAVDDAFAAPLRGLTVYGKSTQDGTPSPDNPVPIISVGDGGTILVTVGDGADRQQTIALQTPNGLRGIPVASGGNYTDKNGQRWICDEVDLERGIYIKRVAVAVLTVDRIQALSSNTNDYCIVIKPPIDYKYATNIRTVLMSNRFRYEKQLKNKGVIFGYGNQIRLYVDQDEIKTLDAAKEFIEKNQIEIMYEVNVHVETPLTPAELAAYKALTTYAPNTVVQASDGAGVKLGYQRDVNIAIKKLEDAIASMTAT